MGFLSAYSGTERIALDGQYWVDVKNCLSIQEKNRAERALMTPVVDLNGRGSATVDMVGFRNAMMAASIVGWNIDDDDGAVWPLEPPAVREANISRLPGPVFDQIWEVVNRLNGPRDPAEAARFPVVGVGGDPDGHGGSAESGDVQP